MKTVLILVFVVCAFNSFCQQPKQKGLHTEVFTLSTCEPNEISVRKEGDPMDVKNISVRRLSINANRFSAFKITGINPLRYKYFINNQFISKFFDANDISLGDLTKDTTNLAIDTIQVLQLFNSDVNPKKDNKDIEESKKKIKQIKDSLRILRDDIDMLTTRIKKNEESNKISYNLKDTLVAISQNKDLANLLNKQTDTLNGKYYELSLRLNDELDALGSLIASNINSNAEDILINFGKLDSLVRKNKNENISIIKLVSKIVADAADGLKNHLKQVDSLLNKLPYFLGKYNSNRAVQQSYRSRYDSTSSLSQDFIRSIDNVKLKTLIDLIGKVKVFAPDKTFTIDTSVFRSNDYFEIRRTLFDIEEFASTEKIKLEESFVIFTSLEIGKLLQNEVINCSRFQNQLRDQTCLDESKIAEIKQAIQFDSTLHRYIQDVCANLNVFIKYLELNNAKFNTTVANINSNYRSLLKFITVLDYTYKRNTILFTLPVHNNYRNADLIRYTVEKRDKFTGSYEPYVYDIWLKGGLKIDFSIAIMMSRITDFTYNKLPFYTTTKDSSGNQLTALSDNMFYLKKADLGDYAFAFGGMVNVMFRTGGWWVTPGISAGIAYSTSQNLQFLLGGSLQFGKSERLIAHFGMAAGLARRLDLSQYTILSSSKKKDEGVYTVMGNQASASVSYINRYIFRPFFGISYNLSKKNALNAVGTGADNFNGAFPK